MSVLTRAVFSNSLRNSKSPFLSASFPPKGIHRRSKSKLNSYVITKYVDVVKVFEDKMKKYFPKGAKFYEVFSVGLKHFKADCVTLYKVFKKVTTHGWTSLSRKELEIYYQLPKDMIKAAPIVIIGAGIPFGAFIFVIAYNFPRQLLTQHFWSEEQKSEFALLSHKRRLQYYKPLFASLENQLKQLKDNAMEEKVRELLEVIKKGERPNIDLILLCREVFERPPYGLKYLPKSHIVKLLKLYNLHRGWRRRARLEHRALLLKLMDTAIVKEGGLEKLSQGEIQFSCFIRGLNTDNMEQEEIVNWLNAWLTISEHVNEKSYSLLLHCPLFLGCNQPCTCW